MGGAGVKHMFEVAAGLKKFAWDELGYEMGMGGLIGSFADILGAKFVGIDENLWNAILDAVKRRVEKIPEGCVG